MASNGKVTDMSELEEFKALLNKPSPMGYFQGWNELAEVDWEHEGYVTIYRKEGENRRWYQRVVLVTKSPTGKLYRWSYDEGLTENQDNEFCGDDIIEVREIEETIVVKKYVAI